MRTSMQTKRTALRCILLATLMVMVAVAAAAVDPQPGVTFNKDVLPILQENCQTCHRPYGLNLGGLLATTTRSRMPNAS